MRDVNIDDKHIEVVSRQMMRRVKVEENVIMGRLIPAGTGMEFDRKIKIPEEDPQLVVSS